MTTPGVVVEAVDADGARAAVPALLGILRDAVDGGASVGFLPPLAEPEASDYWEDVVDAVKRGTRVLLVARRDGLAVGTAQLDLCTRPNGRHRAEVTKVMVLGGARRRGVGRALMLACEDEARRRRRTTLVLDTRHGDAAERLYRALGWVLVGTIPRYAANGDGGLDPTAVYYKLLDDGGPTR